LRTLIFGYGNLDRQDDGVAWHILVALRRFLALSDPDTIDDEILIRSDLSTVFQLQLTPELAEELTAFDRVCFIDAHTGAVPEEIHIEKISPTFQHSPLTHHLTPQSLLSIMQSLYKKEPDALLISVRGYEFEFSQSLSSRTSRLVPEAVEKILIWLKSF